MLIGHKIALDPDSAQATYLKKACGGEGSGPARKTRVKPASAKQEVSFVPV
jgi:hypothetical protein